MGFKEISSYLVLPYPGVKYYLAETVVMPWLVKTGRLVGPPPPLVVLLHPENRRRGFGEVGAEPALLRPRGKVRLGELILS